MAVLLALGLTSVASADTCTFQGSDWHTASEWSGCSGQVPDTGDDVVIPSPFAASVSTADASASSVVLASGAALAVFDGRTLDIDGNSHSFFNGDVQVLDAGSTLRLDNTTWRSGSWAIGGEKGTSTLDDPGGRVEVAGNVELVGVGLTARDSGGGRLVTLPTGSVLANDATTNLAVPFENDGRVRVGSKGLTLSAGSGGPSDGTYVLVGLLRLGGEHTISSAGSVGGADAVELLPGTLRLASGAGYNTAATLFSGGWLSLAGAGSSGVVWSTGRGGGRSGTGTLAVGSGPSTLDNVGFIGGGRTIFEGEASVTGGLAVSDAGTLVRFGNFTEWRAGTWSIGGQSDPATTGDDGGTVENAGTLRLTGDTTANDLGSGTIANLLGAELSREESMGAATLLPPLSNAGTLNIATGTLAAAVVQNGGATNVASTLVGSARATGGTLTGGGTITGHLDNVAATVSPGNLPSPPSDDGFSPGTLSVGSYSQGPSGTLLVELRDTTPGSGFDVLQVGGPASLGGAVIAMNSFDPPPGTAFSFLTATTVLGEFGSLTGGGVAGGGFALDYPASDGAVRLVVIPGPEPPVNTSPPTITGKIEVGSTLSCSVGEWTDVTSFSFQWLVDGTPIAGANDEKFVPGDLIVGRNLSCRVTASGPGGSAVATSPIVVIPPSGLPPTTSEPKPVPRPTAPATPTSEANVAAPTAAEWWLSVASPTAVAKAFGLASGRRCIPRGTFVIRLRRPRGVRIVSAQVRLNEKRVRLRRAGGRFTARVDLRRFPKGRFTVKVRIRTASERTLHGTRRYRTCASRRHSRT